MNRRRSAVQVSALPDSSGWQPVLVRTLPFALYMAFLAAAPLLHGSGGLDERWLYGIKISLVGFVLLALRHQYGELKHNRLNRQDWALAILIGVTVFVAWINLDQPWATLGKSAGFNPAGATGQIDFGLASVRLFGAAVVVPVMEELFWRSFVMRWLESPVFLRVRPAAIGLRPFLLTAALFASEHQLILAGLLAGLAYNWLYTRTGKLWVPILAHALTNGLLGGWVLMTRNWQFW